MFVKLLQSSTQFDWGKQNILETTTLPIAHTIHGTGIFTYIYHKQQPFMDR